MSFNLARDFLVMSIKHKTEKVNWEELGTNASFLPLIYLMIMAPGFLALFGLSCFLAVGVSSLHSDLSFHTGYLLTLGGTLFSLGFILILAYRLIIKYQFQLKKSRALQKEKSSPASKSHVDQVLQPFLKQLMDEHRLFLNKDV